MPNSISTLMDRKSLDVECMQIATFVFHLGIKMAESHERFESPFDSSDLTHFWEAGFLHAIYVAGLHAPASATILDCPYRDSSVVSKWCDGLAEADENRRKMKRISRVSRKRRILDWDKVGF